METNQEEILKKQGRYCKLLASMYKRDSVTLLEMSNTLNWVISLATALFFFLKDKLVAQNDCHILILLKLFYFCYFALILLYVLYKLVFTLFKRELDEKLAMMEDDLLIAGTNKIVNKEILVKEIGDKIRMLNLISEETFQLVKCNHKSIDPYEKTKIDIYKCCLNYAYFIGIAISFILLLLVIYIAH